MMKQIPTYQDQSGTRVVFIPHVFQGNTHRVEVNDIFVGFLPRPHKPTPVTAEFYLNKYHRMGGPG